MSHTRGRFTALLTTAALALTLSLTAITPASASGPVRQCNPGGYCLNFWNGGYALSAYHGVVANDAISIQSLPGSGNFQLRDGIRGGCVGDNGAGPNSARAGGGLDCNSTTTGGGGGWGTRFQRVSDSLCPAGYYVYWNYHWLAYLSFSSSNGSPAYLNGTGTCLKQLS